MLIKLKSLALRLRKFAIRPNLGCWTWIWGQKCHMTKAKEIMKNSKTRPLNWKGVLKCWNSFHENGPYLLTEKDKFTWRLLWKSTTKSQKTHRNWIQFWRWEHAHCTNYFILRACLYEAGWPVCELARQQRSPGLYERIDRELSLSQPG